MFHVLTALNSILVVSIILVDAEAQSVEVYTNGASVETFPFTAVRKIYPIWNNGDGMELLEFDGTTHFWYRSEIDSLKFNLNTVITSINEANCPVGIRAFPNPSSDRLYVEYDCLIDNRCWMEVYSMNGALVRRWSVEDLRGEQGFLMWDWTDDSGNLLANDTYALRFVSKSSRTETLVVKL